MKFNLSPLLIDIKEINKNDINTKKILLITYMIILIYSVNYYKY